MIPTKEQAIKLWKKYQLPEKKHLHCELVAKVVSFLTDQLCMRNERLKINKSLVIAGALLHDIDKNISKLPGEQHPDAAVRILKKEGMEEVARIVETHPLHAIIERAIRPRTLEEKILFLADKMVKYEILTVDKRFAIWYKENQPSEALRILKKTYAKVKKLEQEIISQIGIKPEKVAQILR